MVTDVDREKRAAAVAAAAVVEDGMLVGLGTGSTVAFLLPELEGAAVEHGPLQLPSNGRPNFVDFEVLVAGQAIRPNLEVRAFQNGRDITGRLHAAGLAQRVRLGFPARSVLEVQHKYRPVVGGGVHHRHRHGRFGNQALLRRS